MPNRFQPPAVIESAGGQTTASDLLTQLEALEAELLAAEHDRRGQLDQLHRGFRSSGRNLVHYLALRRHDLRPLQEQLTRLGLSSLGRAEAHVLATLRSVQTRLRELAGTQPGLLQPSGSDFACGRELLAQHADDLLGPAAAGRGVRIMVTLPTEAAHDPVLIEQLLRQGMDAVRINTAHDTLPVWQQMIDQVRRPARIGLSVPAAVAAIRVGDPVWFDDGRIGGRAEQRDGEGVAVRIEQIRPGGDRLRADKGINLPETPLSLPAISTRDAASLAFAAAHADVVELSFANGSADVVQLQQHLADAGRRHLPIVLKIETKQGFDCLPEMLLTAMRLPACGVMIARGDLAVECGFARLAEVQEEILWVCEAAHVPVIWATQVLESLARRGQPSRAEITDAAMGHRAECVMLNKGPHVVEAVRSLDEILRRMEAHQDKKKSMLRQLRLAGAELRGASD